MVASSRGDPNPQLLIKLDGRGPRALTQQRSDRRRSLVPQRAVSMPGATGVAGSMAGPALVPMIASLVPRPAVSLPAPAPVPVLTGAAATGVAGSVAGPALVPVPASIPVSMPPPMVPQRAVSLPGATTGMAVSMAGSTPGPMAVSLVPRRAESLPPPMPAPVLTGAASAGMAGFVADSMFMYSANDIGHMSTENLGVDAKGIDAVFLNEMLSDFEPASKQPRLV